LSLPPNRSRSASGALIGSGLDGAIVVNRVQAVWRCLDSCKIAIDLDEG